MTFHLDPRWSKRLLAQGSDPDPRFSLANERTFLAWTRTALGMIALGVGVATFVSTQQTRGFSMVIAVGLVVLGGVIAAMSWNRWLRVERAMRRGEGVPPSRTAPILAIGIGILAVLAIVVILLSS